MTASLCRTKQSIITATHGTLSTTNLQCPLTSPTRSSIFSSTSAVVVPVIAVMTYEVCLIACFTTGSISMTFAILRCIVFINLSALSVACRDSVYFCLD